MSVHSILEVVIDLNYSNDDVNDSLGSRVDHEVLTLWQVACHRWTRWSAEGVGGEGCILLLQ